MATGNRLQGKVAIVTGGGGGIGGAVAALFCEQGAGVLLVDADEATMQRTSRKLREVLPQARVAMWKADVSDEAAAQAAVALAVSEFGGLDILVNNAAARNYSALADASRDEWESVLRVNLLGTATYSKAALPQLRKRPGASIVNVSSCYAVTGRKGMGIYDTTKAGMLAMTRTLAFEEAPNGVRVNAICPGSTLTEFHIGRAKAAGRSAEALKAERTSTSLLARWADPREIAFPILWLASSEASFITGTTLLVDGGLHVM
jgi:meso-butanediol dehydrogenase/(S,S)-butanediol dehydrogenase/diacetyl reductase